MKSTLDATARSAGILALVEVGLGSWLHGLRIPLTGQFLSLVQGAILGKLLPRS